jgi:hypothetical protein
MMAPAMRRSALLLAALVLAACSHDEPQGKEDGTGTTTHARTTVALEVVDIPVEATSDRRPGRFASRKELEWAAAWMAWEDDFARLFDRMDSILSVPERAAGAAEAGSKDNKALLRGIRAFRSCSEDAAERGAPPSTRLETVAAETAEVCARVEAAGARLEAEGYLIGFPSEAIHAETHLNNAAEEAWSFIPGLEVNVLLREGASHGTRTQILYTLATSRLVREQVTITCYSPPRWRRELRQGPKPPGKIAGFVMAHTAGGNLSPTVCRWLDRLAYTKAPPTELLDKARLAQALATLGHEAEHARGTRSERVAECRGMQRIAPLAHALGASAAYGRELAELFWNYIYPYAPSTYSSGECRPGGKLDMRKRVAAWP